MSHALALFTLLAFAAGQDQHQPPRQWGGEEDRLQVEEYYRYRDLLLGKRSLNDASAAETELNLRVVQKAARWYVYRLTWPEYQRGDQGKSLNDLVQEACAQIPRRRQRQPLTGAERAFLVELGGQLVKRSDEIGPGQPVIVRLNAARILACLAEAGLEQAADSLVRIVADRAESDAVKLYALRGLRSMFAAHAERPVFQSPARELRCIQAMVAYIERPRELPRNAAIEEVDGLRYVRREAIRALGGSAATAGRGSPEQERACADSSSCSARRRGARPESLGAD
jgi:hypothetical protein